MADLSKGFEGRGGRGGGTASKFSCLDGFSVVDFFDGDCMGDEER